MQNNSTSLQLQLLLLQQQQQQQQQNPPANYTLPGVINYLTSEFTNLERYKIMNNLEKSEMKYKINQLQGEVNSLKYIGERQANRINLLEKENALLKEKIQSTKGGEGQLSVVTTNEDVDDIVTSLPEIDLLVVKKSREQLTRTMKEVVYLLRAPSPNGYHYLNLPDPTSTSVEMTDASQYDELFNSPVDSNEAGYPVGEFDVSSPSSEASQNKKQAGKPSSGAPGFSKYLSEEQKKTKKKANSKSRSNSEGIDQDLFGEIFKMEDKSSKGIRTIDSEEDVGLVDGNIDFKAAEPKYSSFDTSAGESDAETVTHDSYEEFSFNKLKLNDDGAVVNVNEQEKDDTGAPGITLSTYVEGYTLSKVFSGKDDGLLVYMNYNKIGSNTFHLTVYDTTSNKVVVSSMIPLSNDMDPCSIFDIYCLTDATPFPSPAKLIMIFNFGTIESIYIGPERVARVKLLSLKGLKINATSLIEFRKSDPKSNEKSFGLTFTTHHKDYDGQLRVFQLNTEKKSNFVELKDIGTYSRTLFGVVSSGELKTFEVINWFLDEENNYSPIVQVSDKLVQINLTLKKISVITKSVSSVELPPSSWKLLTNEKYVLLKKGDSEKIELYDISQKKAIGSNDKPKLENLVVIKDEEGKFRIISLDLEKGTDGERGGTITIYDKNLVSEFKLEVGELQGGELGRCGGKVILLDDNIVNLIEIPE